MTLVLIALAAGTAVGLLRGGHPRGLLALRPRRARLLGTALGAQVLSVWAAAGAGALAEVGEFVAAAAAVALVIEFGWLNRRIHGVALAAAGVVLARIGDLVEAGTLAGRVPLWLGEVVPVAFPPRPEMVSPGDVLLAAGLGLLLAVGLTAHRTAPAAPVPTGVPVPGPAAEPCAEGAAEPDAVPMSEPVTSGAR